MGFRENEMAEAKFQMHRKAGNEILPRNKAVGGGNDTGMLFKGVLQTISSLGIVHFKIDALPGRLQQTEKALLRFERFRWPINAPVTFLAAEVRIDFVGLKLANLVVPQS